MKPALAVALLLWGGAAQAESPEDMMARARTHFEAGRALYALNNYADALREFTAGYQLVPKPRFLLNIGHCHRKLNQHDKARDAYKKFLAEVAPDDPDRAEAQKYLAETETALANAPPPSPPPVEVKPENTVVSRPATQPEKKSSGLKHLAWAIPVGVVVIVGVSLGAYFGTRSSLDCTGATIACINAVP